MSTPPSANAYRYRPFALFFTARVLNGLAVNMLAVAIGWQVYDITRDPFDLGLVGLAHFAPSVFLVLVTGATADRFPRRLILMVCMAVQGAAAAGLVAFTAAQMRETWPVFLALVALGTARAFYFPASQAMVRNLVPVEALGSAITGTGAAWQLSSILGPVLGGLLYDVAGEIAYGTAFGFLAAAALLIGLMAAVPQTIGAVDRSWASLVAGFRYLWRERVVLGAISLDLFAVLMGGAVALLPAVARDVLEVGPWGLGLLRAGTGIGAVLMAVYLTLRPIRDHAGLIMFLGVAVFGAGTVVFGLSTVPWLSIAALIVMGAGDMISVTIRETLIQLWTPDALRGRVTAVNAVFVGASNELGEFRAGTMAAVIGIVPAIVVGGVGAVAVAALLALWFPELRRARRLDVPVAV